MEVRELREALRFICRVEFWRMAFFWTLSLVMSYLQTRYPRKTRFDFSRPATSSIPRKQALGMEKPICVITGATSGLGAAAACALSTEGFYVILAGRSSHLLSKVISDIRKGNKNACVKAFHVDVSSFQSILRFKSALKQWLLDSDMHCSVQLLINNAGILARSCRLTTEGYDQMMATNYLGSFFLTNVLLSLLENSPIPSRVVNVTSFTHRNVSSMQVDKDTISGKCFSQSRYYPFAHIYEYSKLCLLLFSYELHRQFNQIEKPQHISVIAVDPGAVKTNIMREIPLHVSQMAFFSLKLLGLLQLPEKGISSILDAALAPPEVTGVYLFGGKGSVVTSSALSYDTKLSKDLWTTSYNIFQELQMAFKDTS